MQSVFSAGLGRPQGQQRGVFPPQLPSARNHCFLQSNCCERAGPQLGLVRKAFCAYTMEGLQTRIVTFYESWERLNRSDANDPARATVMWWEEPVSQWLCEDALGWSEMGFETQILRRRSVELTSASLVVEAGMHRSLTSTVFCV